MKWTEQFRKAVTFSYDDGVVQDERLVRLFNKFGLKSTFNVNSGLCGEVNARNEKIRLRMDELAAVYRGHEVAIHSKSHPSLSRLPMIEIEREIIEDQSALERALACRVDGMAYPFGDFSDEVVSILKKIGIRYARTVLSNHRFDVQTDLLRFEPTCHHFDRRLPELIETFLSSQQDSPRIFSIWGHSWEFDDEAKWNQMETACKALANHQDVFYGTNREVLLNETDRIPIHGDPSAK